MPDVNSSPKRILLVEDQAEAQYLYDYFIKGSAPGAVIDTAETLQEACQHLSRTPYSAIVLDNQFPHAGNDAGLGELRAYGVNLEMQQESGVQLLDALRRKCFPLNSRCPVYFHSTNMSQELSATGKRYGAAACAMKDAGQQERFKAFIARAVSPEQGPRFAA